MRKLLAAFAIATIAAALPLAPPVSWWLTGLSQDLLLLGRSLTGGEDLPARSPSVVIAIDEETYRRAPFAGTPKAAWPRHLGEVYAGVLDTGAVVIGQDVVLPTSLESLSPGIDRPYLAALARYGRGEGRIVLGAARHQGEEIGPHPSHRLLVGGDANIRLLNLRTDRDGIARQAPLAFGDGDQVPGFAAELAARAGWASAPGVQQINFRRDGRAVPVYSLADILACVQAGDTTYLEAAFRDRVVLIGAVLDIEDRKATSARFLGRRDSDHFAPRCRHEPMSALYGDPVGRSSVPGVLIHAQIVNDLLLGDGLFRVDAGLAALLGWLLALGASVAGLFLRPFAGLATLGGVIAAPVAGGLAMLSGHLILPVLPLMLAAGGAGALAHIYRFVVADRDKRMIRQSFARYLSPPVVDEMVSSGKVPEPGGEAREVTIWFSDLAGFTRMSEGMTPEDLVAALNEYLTVMTEVITSHRGMIDKYIGDAVVGVFGAPIDDPDHARNALAAAVACQAALEALRASRPGWPDTRIGLNTGRAVVGNIGSAIRLDYTVMGDAVNLASRLESLNKRYGLTLLASESTVTNGGDSYMRLVDVVQVVGRSAPTRVYGLRRELSDEHLAAYATALSALGEGEFEAARAGFEELAPTDPAARNMAEQIAAMGLEARNNWTGHFRLDKK